MKRSFLPFMVLIFSSLFGLSQPANDDCVNAQAIVIPVSGDICVTGTTALANGTIYTSHPCFPIGSSIPDVWYTFIAAGTQNTITVTQNGGSPAQQLGVSLTSSPCGGATLQTCNMSATATGSATAVWTYPVGTQIWVNVSSIMAQGGFQICINSITPPNAPGEACNTATILCDKSTVIVDNLVGFTSSATWPSCFANAVQQDIWYKFTVGQTGTCLWTATPLAAVEYDWAMYDITSGCPGTEVACNYYYATGDGAPGSPFGMAATASGEFEAGITLTVGNTYALLIDNYVNSSDGFELSWGGTFQMAPTSIFTALNPTGCGSVTTTFSNTSIAASSYSWDFGNGSTSTALNPPAQTYSAPGNYLVSLTTTSTTGCVDNSSATVIVNPIPTVSVNSNSPICQGTSLNLTSTSADAISYSWSGPNGFTSTSQNPTIAAATPAAAGTYTVTVTTAGGCSGTAQLTVNVSSSLNISVNPTAPSICPGASIQLTANGGQTYVWSPGTGLSGTSGTTVTASPTTTTMYSVTGTDASGCSGSTTVTVNISPISATASATDENCGQANGSLSSTASGNCNQAFTYAWNTIPAQFTQNVNNVSQGTYTVTISCGACTTTATATVNNLPGPSVSFSSITNATCSLPNGSTTASPTGGNPPYTYQWNSSPAQYAATLSNVSAGTYNVTLTDANNCTAVNTVTISNIPGPSAAVTGITDASCGMSDGSAQLTVNAGTQPFSYNWNSTPVQTGQNLQNVPMGNYSVTVTDANSCTATANVTIGQTGGPTASATSTNEICNQANGTATVVAQNGSGTYTYLWSNGQVTSTATGLAAGNYTVTVDDGACTTIASAGVMNIPGPNAGFSAHPTIVTPLDGPVSFLDNSSGNIVGWQWNFGDGSPFGSGESITHPYENIGDYLVTLIVTDNNGCTDTTVDTIKVKEIFTFYIPNVFTPNGDGINDLFTPRGLSVDIDNFNMQIFDRWGNVMFQTNKWLVNSAEPWNGTQNNSGKVDNVVMDVYVYRIRLKEIDGPKHDYIGRITLIP